MGTISAKKITAALDKAKDVGVVEEPLTIGDVTIVLRNLRPDQYTAIYEENKEREGIDSLYSFQKGHICRSLVEVNGVDLRDVDFVEVEEEVKDPKTQDVVIDPQTNAPKIKKVRLERHDYVAKYILNGWAKEAIQVAWRKFGDVLKLAEDKAKEGVKFVLPEMTPEERLREALGNFREVVDDVPNQLVDSILEEAGLMRISTADEIKRVMEKTDQLARDQEAAQEAAASGEPPVQPQQVPPTPTGPRVRHATPEDIMARRTPMNREAVIVPSPTVQPVMASPQTVVPAPPQGPPQPPAQVPAADAVKVVQRAQQIARLETDGLDLPAPPPGDPNLPMRHVVPGQATPTHAPNAPHLQTGVPPEVAVLSQKGREKVDMQAFDKIVNKPQMGGINPRFRAPR